MGMEKTTTFSVLITALNFTDLWLLERYQTVEDHRCALLHDMTKVVTIRYENQTSKWKSRYIKNLTSLRSHFLEPSQHPKPASTEPSDTITLLFITRWSVTWLNHNIQSKKSIIIYDRLLYGLSKVKGLVCRSKSTVESAFQERRSGEVRLGFSYFQAGFLLSHQAIFGSDYRIIFVVYKVSDVSPSTASTEKWWFGCMRNR